MNVAKFHREQFVTFAELQRCFGGDLRVVIALRQKGGYSSLRLRMAV